MCIRDSSNAAPNLLFTDSDHNPDFGILASSGQFRIQDTTNTANLMTLDSSKIQAVVNLDALAGIDVTGAITATGSVSTDEVNISTATAGSQKTLKLINTNASAGTNEITFSSTTSGSTYEAASIRNGVPNHLNGSLQFKTANGSGLQTAMIIDNSQNVGIGTTSPSYKLEIVDSDGSLLKINTSHEGTYDLRYVYQNSEANIWSYGSTDLTFGTRYNKKLHFVYLSMR